MAGHVAHVYNPRTQKAEAGGLRVLDQSGQHRDPVCKRKKQQQK